MRTPCRQIFTLDDLHPRSNRIELDEKKSFTFPSFFHSHSTLAKCSTRVTTIWTEYRHLRILIGNRVSLKCVLVKMKKSESENASFVQLHKNHFWLKIDSLSLCCLVVIIHRHEHFTSEFQPIHAVNARFLLSTRYQLFFTLCKLVWSDNCFFFRMVRLFLTTTSAILKLKKPLNLKFVRLRLF